jgi:DNA helicase-2/ATP-dependent DNA helicase PcrA
VDETVKDKPWLQGVEGDEGKDVIENDKPFIQVVAGPGSGKTFGLQRRVQRLVVEEGVKRSEIFVGTFTRAIRAELASSLASSGGEPDNDKIVVETLHSHAYALLREYEASRPGRQFRFLLKHEEDAMLYDLKDAVAGLDFNARRDEMHKVESFWAGAENLKDEQFRGAMVTWLQNHGAMHINEVGYIALNAMRRGDVPTGQFRHVVVDEYQDLTFVEQELVGLLCAPDGCLMVLGDDDQSIYRFRYNHPGGIGEFPNGKDGDKIAQISLPENRRCGATIVDLANLMMAAAGPTKPPMIARSTHTGEVDAIHWPTLDNEVDGLADYISSKPDNVFLVMVTRREIGYRLRDRIGTDAWTSFHEEVLRTDIVRERFSLASLLANEDDAVSVRAWLGFKADGSGSAPEQNSPAVISLKESGLQGRALLNALQAKNVAPSGTGSEIVKKRAENYLSHLRKMEGMDLAAVISYVFDPSLAATINDPEDQKYAADDLSLLKDAALQMHTGSPKLSFSSIIERLRYRISTRQPLFDEEPDARVRIMTLHGAKGLEADIIVVAGLADELLPGKDDPEEPEAKRAEQRRLLYVAVTRAKRHLILSWPQSMSFRDAKKQGARDSKTFFSTKLMRRLGSCRFIPTEVQTKGGIAWLKTIGVR